MTTFSAVDADGHAQAIALNDDPPKAAKQDAQTALLTAIAGNVDGLEAALALLATLTGEVQASPTSNTVLDRLKSIATAINAPALATAGKSYTPENLVSNTRSTALPIDAGREFYCKLTGSGSATVTLVYSMDNGSTYQYMATGVDGSAPIVSGQVAYSNSPMILRGQVDKAGMRVALLPGSVTGTVTVEFGQ